MTDDVSSLDVTEEQNITGLRKQVQELTGETLDILVNNAYVHVSNIGALILVV